MGTEDVGERLVNHLLHDLALLADDASKVHEGDGQVADDCVDHIDLREDRTGQGRVRAGRGVGHMVMKGCIRGCL